MNRRTLMTFAFAVIFSVGGTFSLIAQEEAFDQEPVIPEGDPTTPTAESPELSPNMPTSPFSGAGPMAFQKEGMPYSKRAMNFQGNPMAPGGEGPMFFPGASMPCNPYQMSSQMGQMRFGRRPGARKEENMMSPEDIMEHLNSGLELTDEQKSQLLPLLEKKFSQSRERSGRQFSYPQGDENTTGQELEARFKEILTDEQMQKLQEMEAPYSGQPSFPGLMAESSIRQGKQPMAPPNNQMARGPMFFGGDPMMPHNQMARGPMFFGGDPMMPLMPQETRRMGPPSFREQMGPGNEEPMAPPNNQMARGPMQQGMPPMFFGRCPMMPQRTRRMEPPSFREQMGVGNGQMPFAKSPIFSRGLDGESAAERPEMNPEELIEDLSTELELTEEQAAEVQRLLKEYFSSPREQIKTSRGQKRQQFQEGGQHMWQEIETQLMEILTEKQLQKLRELKEARLGHFPPFGSIGGPGGMFGGPLSDLQLSQEQRQEIFTVLEKYGDSDSKNVQNFLDMQAAVADLLKQDVLDEQEVRKLFRQQTSQWEERFVERTKMLAEIKGVLKPEQVDMLQKKGAAFIDMMGRWDGARQY